MDSQHVKVIKFGASWCSPCRSMSPIVHNVLEEHSDVELIDIDIDGEYGQEVAREFGIRSIPTFILVDGGKVVNTLIGAASESEFREFLSKK